MHWRYFNTGYNTAAYNMALDETLLDSSTPILRVYGWRPAAMSLGYSQNLAEINIEQCRSLGVDIVRRITGGKAVLHDQELTYSVIIKEELLTKELLSSYKKISQGILNALEILGLKATMNKAVESKPKSAVCFNEPSWYEIIVNNKKIVGSAQKRTNGKILQHGSILLDLDIEKMCSLFKEKELIPRLQNRITSINKELGKTVTFEELATHLKNGFEKAFNIKFTNSELTEQEKNKLKQLLKKYTM